MCCIVVLYCIVLYCCIVLLYCIVVLYCCIVLLYLLLYCIAYCIVVSYCCVVLYCLIVSYCFIVLLYRIVVLYCIVLYPGSERIMDVTLGRRRNSNLGQGSEVKVPCSSNNLPCFNIWNVYCVPVSELQQGENWRTVTYRQEVLSVCLAGRLVKKCLLFSRSYVMASRNYGKFGG